MFFFYQTFGKYSHLISPPLFKFENYTGDWSLEADERHWARQLCGFEVKFLLMQDAAEETDQLSTSYTQTYN
jgi:hypothetical protein